MSGGAYDYKYCDVDEYYVGRMYDVELDEMMKDLVDLLRSLEWWRSADACESDYREVVHTFKDKWMHRTDEDALCTYKRALQDYCDKLKAQL